jgi:hypothetical protein
LKREKERREAGMARIVAKPKAWRGRIFHALKYLWSDPPQERDEMGVQAEKGSDTSHGALLLVLAMLLSVSLFPPL